MESRSLLRSQPLRIYERIAEEQSIHRDIMDQLEPYPLTRQPVLYLLITYYLSSFAMTCTSFYLLRSESPPVRLLLSSSLLITYILNGQIRLETDLFYRIGLSHAPGADIIRNIYISRGKNRWPGCDFKRFQDDFDEKMKRFLPRSDPMERFKDLQEYKSRVYGN